MRNRLLMAFLILGAAACGSSSGTPTQSSECSKYITCQKAIAADTGAALDATYGPQGTCWKGTQEDADACTATCISTLATLRNSSPDQAECK